MDNEEIIKLLNIDFVHELEATMVYAYNSFIIKDCEVSRLTEAISVDEMRHMWWLADLIVKRGGKPTMEHRELDFSSDDLITQLKLQIEKETEGIDEYQRQVEIIDDEEVVGVLKHIIDEEKRHRKEFNEHLKNIG
ncbi:MAG: ferritin-like domain-containing protein [Methanobacteriaceae archaeon]|nr:ferritin-like domain-containing protein [Methanobacteriaceae archaeon]MDO9044048.1 ferritin-like domain-containing protein [Methanobacteriaceae archaeon]MDO9627618.1 ferritin-like domain-containing protein [Methanobacteriaceae archaeon]MDP2836784.1 ferritin-like domain-containing protein [Methanobacteriaceae archaeon]MDP3484251.1 ferritin-like domain-containing protein [Methanobacteriaceae archaeon]